MTLASHLGRYELLARIATGGMGEIFLARLEGVAGFEKLYVIKRILPHLAEDERFRQMLIDEATVASNMSHANICHVYELDEIDRQLYIVMEYLEGATLQMLLRRVGSTTGQLDFGFVAGVVQQAAEGLHYAHELRDRQGRPLGVVHRDVTPSNLFLTESGVVKLVDFGIAKVERAATTTDAGTIKGKYAYMAPEQLRGQEIDRRADVYALGVVAFEMLTCRRLFQRKTDFLTFQAVMEQPLLDLGSVRPEAPAVVTEVLHRALDRDPARRYDTVRALARDFTDALLGSARPWDQGEISELVRGTFAEEISQHNTDIASLITRPGRAARRSMPVILREMPFDRDDADYFAFETSVGEEEPAAGEPIAGFDEHSGALAMSGLSGLDRGRPSRALNTEPGPELVSSLSSLSSLSSGSAPGSAGRSRRWPFAAVIGAAALTLGIGLAVIGRGSAQDARSGAGSVAGGVAGTQRASAAAAQQASGAAARAQASSRYGAAIQEKAGELDRCAHDYGDTFPDDARATIVVAADGRARTITVVPASADRTALAACVREVLKDVRFPAAGEEQEVAVALALSRATPRT